MMRPTGINSLKPAKKKEESFVVLVTDETDFVVQIRSASTGTGLDLVGIQVQSMS